jgi:hypothetical protein
MEEAICNTATKERGMGRALGILLLLASVVVIFLIARRWPFEGIVVLEFEEFWLWLVLLGAVVVAGLGGYLAFRRGPLTRYD